MDKTTSISSLSYDRYNKGEITVRVSRAKWDDGELLNDNPQTRTLYAGDDIDGHVSELNAHLVADGWPEIPAEDVDNLKADADRRWTPERIAAREERDAALQAEIDQREAEAQKRIADEAKEAAKLEAADKAARKKEIADAVKAALEEQGD